MLLGVPGGPSFDLLRTSELRAVSVLLSFMSTCQYCSKHVEVDKRQLHCP